MGNPASRGKRLMAALIDGVLACAAGTLPFVGPGLGLVYLLTKDAWPLLGGQSVGKEALQGFQWVAR